MDIVNTELGVLLIIECLAVIHKLLAAYTFCLANIEVEAKVFDIEEIQLVFLITQLTKFFLNYFEINHLVFGDLFQLATTLCFL